MTAGTPKRRSDWVRRASAWGPVVIYMAAIFFVSAQHQMPLQDKTTLSDKTIHALAYLGLTLFAYRAAVMSPLMRRLDPAIQAPIVSIFYGAWDEIHQYFVPGRNADIRDWLADVVGALIVVLTVILIKALCRKRIM